MVNKQRCNCCDKVLKDCFSGTLYCNNCAVTITRKNKELAILRKRIKTLEERLSKYQNGQRKKDKLQCTKENKKVN